jgi:hypothetical protein
MIEFQRAAPARHIFSTTTSCPSNSTPIEQLAQLENTVQSLSICLPQD